MARYGVPFSKGPEVRLAPHPKSCGLDGVRKLAEATSKPLAIDLFCGAGGLSYGLHLAGFEVILAVDKEPEAVETHRAHFPGASINADLSDMAVLESICEALKGVQIDLIAGGPPCQPYSQAAFSKVRHLQENHGRTDDPRRELWSSYLHIVKEIMPRAVLIENVPEMAFGRDGIVLRRIVESLEAIGYMVHTRVLSAAAYGVPQHRQRLFTVALRDNNVFSWPVVDHSNLRKLKDAISDLPEVEGGDKQEARRYTGTPSVLQAYYRESVNRSDIGTIYDHHTRAVRADDLEAFKLMNSKTTYRDLPEHLKRYRDDIFEDKYKRLDLNQLSRTITAHISQDGYWYIHPTQHRTLTIREAARIQTFPDSFRFCGYPRHAFKQIGEAVPPLFGKALGSAVLESLKTHETGNGIRTSDISLVLKKWISEQTIETMCKPWLGESTKWLQLMGQLMFDTSSVKFISMHYAEIAERWSTPETFLSDAKATEKAEELFKFEKFESLTKLAQFFISRKELNIDLLRECGIPEKTVLRMAAITGMGSRRPLNVMLERVVRRVTGIEQRIEDGKGDCEMLMGRLIGTDPEGKAFVALIEIAGQYCGTVATVCGRCPLQSKCEAVKKKAEVGFQKVLDL